MNFKGLTSQEVETSRRKYGDNSIPESAPVTFWDAFKETFQDGMIRLLLVIAALMFIMFLFNYAELHESLGIVITVFIVAFVTAKTSIASDTKYRALKDSIKKDTCKVYRDGEIKVLEWDSLVVGDMVLIQSGDKIPADGLLMSGTLSVDNSALNGENEECHKTPTTDSIMEDNITGDSFVDSSSLFRGSVVTDGEGVLHVCRVGTSTMMGKMAEEMIDAEVQSPLKLKLSKLADQISLFGKIGASVIGIVYMISFVIAAGGFSAYLQQGWILIGKDFVHALSLAATIIVCAVPEGLPLMISLVLMQNTSKMLDHNVLVRKAIGIETAGSLNILFSDKTGTITKGKLEVVDFFLGDGESVSRKNIIDFPALTEKLYPAIGMNTQSLYDDSGDIVGGNKTDQACLAFLGSVGYNGVKEKYKNVSVKEQGFNSKNKFSQSCISGVGTFYKGAPEQLMENATKYLNRDGEICELDKEAVSRQIDTLAKKSMRVLAFGYSQSSMETDKINSDIVIIGFVSIRDDVRPEAKEAIEIVQDAGIQVVMITGDRKETAVSIATDAGLLRRPEDMVITSQELNNMSDDEVKRIIPDIRVIVRALPTDKSRMVRLCQEMNLVVGMTGDGVNDSPALKRADVGFAMGSGTEAAKEAGEIIVLDDNFKSIKDAVWYGRTIYTNILKFCKFQLVINVAAVLVSALSIFFGIEEPLKVTHLLFVNLVMDSLGAIMLGNEPTKDKYLLEKPRRRDESLISKSMMSQIVFTGLYMTVLSFVYLKLPLFVDLFPTKEQHLTSYFVLFIWAALFNGFNVRDEKFDIFGQLNLNPGFLKVFGIIVLVQAAIVNASLIPIPGFEYIGNMFSCTPFGIIGWIVAVLLAATIIPVDLIRKSLMVRVD